MIITLASKLPNLLCLPCLRHIIYVPLQSSLGSFNTSVFPSIISSCVVTFPNVQIMMPSPPFRLAFLTNLLCLNSPLHWRHYLCYLNLIIRVAAPRHPALRPYSVAKILNLLLCKPIITVATVPQASIIININLSIVSVGGPIIERELGIA